MRVKLFFFIPEVMVNLYYGLDIHFSADCNMRCSYCYLDKDKPRMAKLNDEIREKLYSGAFSKTICEKLTDSRDFLRSIGLWGAEPTLNFDVCQEFLFDVLTNFPNVQTVFFSTNALLGVEPIATVIDTLEQFMEVYPERSLELRLQFSLDGPAWINDETRCKGATENTIQTIRDVIRRYPALRIKLNIMTKLTLETRYMKRLNDLQDGVFGYYKFFDDLQTAMMSLNHNPNISIEVSSLPTIVNPGNHTVEDGRIFAEFVRKVRHVDITLLRHYKHPILAQGLKLLLNCAYKPEVMRRGWGCCSAGCSDISIDCRGNLYTCHRLCGYLATEESRSVLFDYGTKASLPFEKEYARLSYMSSAYHDYPMARKAFFDILIPAMVNAGQIDNRALTDSYYRHLLWIVCTDVYCHIGCADNLTGDMFAFAPGYLRLFGNGALDEFIRYYDEQTTSEVIRFDQRYQR